MTQATGSSVRIYSVVTSVVIITEVCLLRYLSKQFDVVHNTLPVTALCVGSVALLDVLFGCVQNTTPVKIWQVVKGAVLVIIASLIYHLVLVLYGASVTQAVGETYSLACLLAVLTVLPSCAILGVDSHAAVRLYASGWPESAAEACLRLSTFCSLLGAWVGAFAIPLDWDRPWQVWPVTCVVGALGGKVVACVLSLNRTSDYIHRKPKLG